MRAYRRLGCDMIDFMGRTSSKKSARLDERIADAVVRHIADKNYAPSSWDGSIQDYCRRREWLPKAKYVGPCKASDNIPHMDMVQAPDGGVRKQYVLGRMSLLRRLGYYTCPHLFYTLDSEDWDSMYQINDLFVYCAYKSADNPDFPIRIVTSPEGGLRRKTGKRGISDYGRNLLTIPHLLDQSRRIHIASRELCQLTHYFGMRLYRSRDHPHLYFASRKSVRALAPKLSRYNLERVEIS